MMTARQYIYTALTVLAATAAGGCSFIHDDLPPCPTGIDIDFVYDYNIPRADMFHDHVGGVTVYVFDENGRYLTSKEDYNTPEAKPLADPAYRMHLDLGPGSYRFIALAHQKSYGGCLAGSGAKYRRTQPDSPTHTAGDLKVTLDRENGMVPNHGAALDTLWHGMTTHPVVIKDMEEAHTTISLVRDTKNLTVSLHQLDDPAGIDVSDFDISITARNGVVLHDNTVTDSETLTYTPYSVWNTGFTSGGSMRDGSGTDVLERTAHAALSFNRLILHPSAEANADNAMLTIRNKRTGNTVARINLPDCLAQGRGAFEFLNYTPQEFLDREYDYKLDFFLRGDTWYYIDLSISVLSWSKRIQRVELGPSGN